MSEDKKENQKVYGIETGNNPEVAPDHPDYKPLKESGTASEVEAEANQKAKEDQQKAQEEAKPAPAPAPAPEVKH